MESSQQTTPPRLAGPFSGGGQDSYRRIVAALVSGDRGMFGLLFLLLAMVAFFAATAPNFFTLQNFLIIGGLVAATGVMAIAQTFLIISGGIDLSVGGAVALTSVLIGALVGDGMSVWIAALIGLLVGPAIGLINGLFSVKLQMNPLIVTLGTMSLFTGLAYILSDGATTVIASDSFSYIGSGRPLGIPFPLIIFAVVFVIGYLVQRFTVVSQAIYAIGGNRRAAQLSGIRVDAIPMGLYIISGLSASLAAVILTSQLAAGAPTIGESFMLSVITAVILGGASLHGGRGTVLGTLIAVCILGVLQGGLSLQGQSQFIQEMALGIVLLFAVSIDQTVGRRRVGA